MHLSMLSWSSFKQYYTQYFFLSHWLLFHITIVETTDRGERGMNPVAVTLINPQKEYWPSLKCLLFGRGLVCIIFIFLHSQNKFGKRKWGDEQGQFDTVDNQGQFYPEEDVGFEETYPEAEEYMQEEEDYYQGQDQDTYGQSDLNYDEGGGYEQEGQMEEIVQETEYEQEAQYGEGDVVQESLESDQFGDQDDRLGRPVPGNRFGRGLGPYGREESPGLRGFRPRDDLERGRFGRERFGFPGVSWNLSIFQSWPNVFEPCSDKRRI